MSKDYTQKQLQRMLTSKKNTERRECARAGCGLDKLVDDEDFEVRYIVATEHRYGLDKLAQDEDWRMRKTVADIGEHLEELSNDPEWRVRVAVAEQGYGLDKLADDESHWVRAAVARQDYALEVLVNDPDHYVREAVAHRGAFLEQLRYDKSAQVRRAVAGHKPEYMVCDSTKSVREEAQFHLKIRLNSEIRNIMCEADRIERNKALAALEGWVLPLLINPPSAQRRPRK